MKEVRVKAGGHRGNKKSSKRRHQGPPRLLAGGRPTTGKKCLVKSGKEARQGGQKRPVRQPTEQDETGCRSSAPKNVGQGRRFIVKKGKEETDMNGPDFLKRPIKSRPTFKRSALPLLWAKTTGKLQGQRDRDYRTHMKVFSRAQHRQFRPGGNVAGEKVRERAVEQTRCWGGGRSADARSVFAGASIHGMGWGSIKTRGGSVEVRPRELVVDESRAYLWQEQGRPGGSANHLKTQERTGLDIPAAAEKVIEQRQLDSFWLRLRGERRGDKKMTRIPHLFIQKKIQGTKAVAKKDLV